MRLFDSCLEQISASLWTCTMDCKVFTKKICVLSCLLLVIFIFPETAPAAHSNLIIPDYLKTACFLECVCRRAMKDRLKVVPEGLLVLKPA
jgi:hypothetical protein